MNENGKKLNNGFEIAALVLGIVAIIFSWTVILGIICGIAGLIFGIIALKKRPNMSMSIVGIVLASLGLLSSIIIILFGIFVYNTIKDENNIGLDSAKQEFNIENTRVADVISGYTWKEVDGSLLELKKDGSFKYYKDSDDLTNNYYEGTYKVYCGENAIEYIAHELSEYGLTEKEQRDTFSRNDSYSVDNYYCLVLNNEKCIVDGDNIMKTLTITPYCGFYIEDENGLDIANMNTGTYYAFIKQN